MSSRLSFILSAKISDFRLSDLTELLCDYELACSQVHVATEERYVICHATVQGSWDKIARAEIALNLYCQENNCSIEIWRPAQKSEIDGMPYLLEASFVEDSGQTLSYLTYLFQDLGISLQKMQYVVEWLDPNLCSKGIARIQCRLVLPFHLNIHAVRERFYSLCESLNVDGSLELHQY